MVLALLSTTDLLRDIGHLPVEQKWEKLCSNVKGKPKWGRWNVQYNAAHFSSLYLAANTIQHEKAALIRMPTGTGKTGVMAIIVNYIIAGKSCLLVVPSTYLTSQIKRCLNKDFWEKIGKRPKEPIPAIVFLPSDLSQHLSNQANSTIFICTQKALADVYTIYKTDYESLKLKIDIVLVDEGHREPAKTWSKAVRSLLKPTILFSATPYRNDLRMFRIGRGQNYRFSYRFQNAIQDNLVRNVLFHSSKHSFVKHNPSNGLFYTDPNIFAKSLIDFYKQVLNINKPADVSIPRIIVRCDTANSIVAVQKALCAALKRDKIPICRMEQVIGIHETFTNQAGDNRYTNPPNPSDNAYDAVFWIHQYKLVEGIDNSEFCSVAFYEPFKNARSLVQQIGRVIRNPIGDIKANAYVFSDQSHMIKEEWNSYLSFETSKQDIIGAEDIVYAIREAQPQWFYADGKYRTGVSFENVDYWKDIRIPASAQLYDRPMGYKIEDFKNLADLVNDHFEEYDLTQVQMIKKDLGNSRSCITTFFWEIIQTEHFELRGFFNIRLQIVHMYINDRHIFYQGMVSLDTALGGNGPEKIEVDNLLSAIPTKDVQLKEMALINSDLGDMAVRRKNLGGRSLEFSSASLNDHLHFVSAFKYSHNGKRRYIGLTHSRVTDQEIKLISLDDYHKWADNLSREVTSSTKQQNSLLRRFAPAIRKPITATARHLLIDLNEFHETYAPQVIVNDEGGVEMFDSIACEVDNTGKFQCIIKGKTINGTITYIRGRFKIISKDLDEIWKASNGQRRSASSFISSPEIIRVVTQNGLIFADGRFYRPSGLHGSSRLTDLDIFIDIPGLGSITSGEKGTKGIIHNNSWEQGSIFNVIDKSSIIFSKCAVNPDILVCDDLSTEIADFLAIDTIKKTLILIHAKEGKKSGSISVSDLHVVISQAKKNLGIFDAAEPLPRKRGNKWDQPWRWEKNSANTLHRIRKGGRKWDGNSIYKKLDEMRRKTDTNKEVWLVLGNMFGKKEITKVITSDSNPPYHWIQMLYLIHSCQAAVASVGARLRILIGP